MSENRRHDILAVAILLVVPSLLFCDVLLGWGVFYLGDITFYHVPGKMVLRDIVLGGEFPYWNPFFSAGQPLASNPAHEVFYPLTWLILLPDFLYGFQLLALVHIYIAALTMYALLRSLGTTRAAAVIGGLSFCLSGFVLSGLHILPFLFSAAWLPLVCLFTRRYLRQRLPRDFALAAAGLAMQLLIGEPVTILQTGLILGMYALFRGERRVARMLRDVALVGAISIAALLISTVQTLPMLDHYRDSVRSHGLEFRVVSDWSTPAVRVVEMVFPNAMGDARFDSGAPYWGHEYYPGRGGPFFQSIYPGLLVAALAMAAVGAGLRGRGLFLAIAATSFLFALGKNTPLLHWLYENGLARSIRYPEKFVIMGVFATVVFGALALDALLKGDPRIRRIGIAVAAATALIAVIAAALTYAPQGADLFRAVWQLEPKEAVAESLAASRVGWLFATGRGLLLAGLIAAMPRMRRGLGVSLFGIFVVADLGTFVPQLAPRTPRAFFTDPPSIVRDLDSNYDEYRVFQINEWTPKARNRQAYLTRRPHAYVLLRNALGGFSPATYGIRGVMEVDYDLTVLRPTEDFAHAAWELSEKTPDWLNVVAVMSNIRYIGVYRSMKAEAALARNDARYIRPVRFVGGRLNPRYYFASEIVTARSPSEFVQKVAGGLYSKQTAFVEGPVFEPAPGHVLRWGETANTVRIEVESRGTAFLVMSVTPHKYWSVTIDGFEVPAITTNLGYQGVVVPNGRHVVAMRYHNPLIAAGGAVSIATLLALVIACRRRART